MIPFDENKLDEWLHDYESFNYAFRRFCFAHFRVHSVHADFVPNVTRQIHQQWVDDHADWLEKETSEETTTLSHVKICALLLHGLVSESFLGNMYDHLYDEIDKYEFRGTEDDQKKAKNDLVDGREIVLALDFVILIIDWYERNREDKSAAYSQRMTPDMRHDLISYLLSGDLNRKSLYLILKALYLRPADAGATN